jgi:hypothetical protein
MDADEFNRKFHPFPALLNAMSASPKTDKVGTPGSVPPVGFEPLHLARVSWIFQRTLWIIDVGVRKSFNMTFS